MAFAQADSVIAMKRAGTLTDPYVTITDEVHVIISQRIQLDEEPYLSNTITITDAALTTYVRTTSTIPTSNQYYVYPSGASAGLIIFNADKEGTSVSVDYTGKGANFLSAERVFTSSSNGEVTATLQSIIDGGSLASVVSANTDIAVSTVGGTATLTANSSSTAEASKLAKYDATGQLKSAAPTESDDVARKSETDALDTRLDTLETDVAEGSTLSTTLKHGLQTVTVAQASPVRFKVLGCTRVNILGEDGNCESLTPFTSSGAVVHTLSTTQKKSGTYSIKSAQVATNIHLYKDYTYPLDTTKYYVIGCWIYVESFTSGSSPILRLCDVGGVTGRYSVTGSTATVGSWQFVYVKIPTSNTFVGTGFRLQIGVVSGTTTAVYYFDDIRLYEVSATDYTAIGTTYTSSTTPSIDDFIPYVDGVKHVDGVYVRKSGKNIFDGNLESGYWNTSGKTASATYVRCVDYVPVLPNTAYTLSRGDGASLTTSVALRYWTSAYVYISSSIMTATSSFTRTMPSNAAFVTFYIESTDTTLQVQLELGSVATEFQMQNDDYLYLPTTLASSIDRTVYDEVYFRDGAYRKLKRLETDVVLDDSYTWTHSADFTGVKRASVLTDRATPAEYGEGAVIKYNGYPLINRKSNTLLENADMFFVYSASQHALIYVSDSDSGFGEAHVPSAAEWKAYFLGYKMNNGVFGTNYNGTGTKTWIPWGATDNTGAVTVVPTTVSTAISGGTYDYYRLSYQLAASYVEEEIIVGAEGSIGLHTGGNQIEIGEGVIIREVVSPVDGGDGYYYINNIGVTGTNFDYRLDRFIQIYADDKTDQRWIILTHANAYGKQFAKILTADYDTTAVYTVTYTKLDKYLSTANVIDITAEYKGTLGSVVSQNVQDIADLQSKVTVHDYELDYIEAKATNEIGVLSSLNTTDQTDIVTAINEVNAKLLVADIQSAVLTHGWNYLLSDQASPLNLTIKGRTLVNIPGKDGNCESLTPFTGVGTRALSTTQFKSGSNSTKITSVAGSSYQYKDYIYPLDTTKYYILAAWFYIESWTSGAIAIDLFDVGGFTNKRYSALPVTSTIGSWQLAYVKIPTSNTLVGTGFRLSMGSATGTNVFYIDDIRLYEVSSTDYTAIGTTYTASTTPSINDFIPFVDSVKHVDGAYVRKSGKNLIPTTVNDWEQGTFTAIVTSAFALASSTTRLRTKQSIKVLPSKSYVVSISSTTYNIYIAEVNSSGVVTAISGWVSADTAFTTTATTSDIYVAARYPADTTITDDIIVLVEPQLELGSVATAFEAQNNDYLYLPTKIASSIDRTVYDEVYYRDGAYRKLKRLMTDVALDGSLAWLYYLDVAGAKKVYYSKPTDMLTTNYNVTKYDGLPLKNDAMASFDANTSETVLVTTFVNITISDTSTGFGEAHVPSVAEIKAFFYGWKMNNGVFGTNYNGTGTKTWIPWGATDNTGAVTVVPTTVSTAISGGTYDYYRLSYQLAASYVEEEIITGAEGGISLHAGGNQLEIGEGSILREVVTPVTRPANDVYSINSISGYTGTSPLDFKSNRILAVYKDGVRDLAWTIGLSTDTAAWYGGAYAYIVASLYESTSVYTVSYAKKDKYLYTGNVIDITAEYATTDRTVLDLTVQNVADAHTSISTINSRLTNEFTKSGGKRIQTGTSSGVVATLGTPVTVAVTFTYAYTSAPVVNVAITASSVGTAGYNNVECGSVTTTGFTLKFNSYVAQTLSVNWEAIGL